jgi:RimJ/RimL family protein N-acetyltransferase
MSRESFSRHQGRACENMGMRSEPLPQGAGRVILRRLTPADLVRFQAYRHDADVGLFQGWEPVPDQVAIRFLEDMREIQLFPLGAWIQLGIADQQTNDLVGDIGVRVSEDAKEAEIGFTLAREAQGFGLGTEALRELIDLIFNHTDVGRIVAITDERNTRAHRLLLRTGFRKAHATSGMFRGQPCIEHVWEISRPASVP